MKRLLTFLLAAVMMLVLLVPAFAVEEELSISDMNVKQGDTAYLRITLNKSLMGDSIGISYSYDKDALKAVPKSCTWEKKGALQDFNNKMAGAWAASSVMDLQGDLCVLAFKVQENAKFAETQVTCNVIIKKGAETVGEYTLTGTISMNCEHKFGEWTDGGAMGHVQVCELCGKKTTVSHAWNEGTIVHDPEDEYTDLKIYTCTVCGAEKQERVSAEKEDHSPSFTEPPTEAQTEPTAPPATMPVPETRPQAPLETFPEPTHPRETEPQYQTEPEVSHDHNHNNEQGDTQNTNPQDDKNHNKPNDSKNNGQNGQKPSDDKQNQNSQKPSDDKQNQNSQKPSDDKQNQNNQKPSDNSQNQNNQNEQTRETMPPSYMDYNNPMNNTEPAGEPQPGHEGHDHSVGEIFGSQETVPMIVPGNGIIETEEPTHDHEHVHEEEEPSGGFGTAVFVVVLLALMVGLPVYLIRNKKRI